MRAIVLLLVVFVSPFGLLAGCEVEEELFRECPLSQTIIEVCERDSSTTSLTCVVTEHPLCDERICAMWQDSEAFCTRACDDATACPDGATCESYLDFAFCVPAAVTAPPTVTP